MVVKVVVLQVFKGTTIVSLGRIWLFMVDYGRLWLNMVIYSCLRLTMNNYSWSCLNVVVYS